MIEGWYADEHLVLFEASEMSVASARYSLPRWLPGYEAVGLRGWDDLIVVDRSGSVFTVPTLPLTAEHLAAFELPPPSSSLESDPRFIGKVKWYVTPIVFGGDPSGEDNITWVDHEQHGQLVTWWNERYFQLKAHGAGA